VVRSRKPDNEPASLPDIVQLDMILALSSG
jgi:hypothetical protein